MPLPFQLSLYQYYLCYYNVFQKLNNPAIFAQKENSKYLILSIEKFQFYKDHR